MRDLFLLAVCVAAVAFVVGVDAKLNEIDQQRKQQEQKKLDCAFCSSAGAIESYCLNKQCEKGN